MPCQDLVSSGQSCVGGEDDIALAGYGGDEAAVQLIRVEVGESEGSEENE